MVKLVGIIVSILAVSAFFIVTTVFIDRLIFEGNTLFGMQESIVDEAGGSQKKPRSPSTASETFEMLKPAETSPPLSKTISYNSVTRYLKELEYQRRVENVEQDPDIQQKNSNLNIVIIGNLSEVYLQNIMKDFIKRGFNHVFMQRSSERVFFYGFKDESEQIEFSNILFSVYSLKSILGGSR